MIILDKNFELGEKVTAIYSGVLLPAIVMKISGRIAVLQVTGVVTGTITVSLNNVFHTHEEAHTEFVARNHPKTKSTEIKTLKDIVSFAIAKNLISTESKDLYNQFMDKASKLGIDSESINKFK